MNQHEKPLGFSSPASAVELKAPQGSHRPDSAEVISLHGAAAQRLVTDVVCGMTVDAKTTPHRTTYQGQDYFFCSAGCRIKFIGDPPHYLGEAAKAPEPMAHDPVPDGAIYTCPMHPEVRQVGPGSCPICGMALGPV